MLLLLGLLIIIDGICSKDKKEDRGMRIVMGIILICAALILQFRHHITWAAEGQIMTSRTSWYSKNDPTDPFEHKFNADGSAFNENALTCSMRSRDFGKYYRITNLNNGRSVIVRHCDFGPALKYKG
ncbi:MAG: septal ring lytic transglycosylase RlpA family protein, partial [Candidatus Omnitrophota bacterium]|nr:septal ring lytic transglycosylase RlpA family protein [Candidatus Omnitrophota bacterium]